MTINVEYRAELENRRAKITLGSVTLEPGDNKISLEQLEILEGFEYFKTGTENKVFVYNKPEIPEPVKQPETVKEPAKTTKPKGVSLGSITVDDDI